MKVGIISMQRVVNNGSLLQAYALKRIIENFGNEVQFVDFKIEKNVSFNLKMKIFMMSPLVFMGLSLMKNLLLLKLNKFSLLIKEYKTRSNFLYNYIKVLNLSEKPNYSPEVDVLVFGSDEVFNTVQYVEQGKGYVWQLYGADNKARKLVSYAASFGYTTYEKLEKYDMVDTSRKLLGNFESFSVRDKNSYDIIKTLTGRESDINIDPVLLYDFEDVEIKKPKIKNYILVYSYPGRFSDKSEIEAIKEFAKKYNKKIVCVNMMQTWCDEFIYAHPFELLGYFKYADYVVSDTFHGAVISIKYNVQFVQFVRHTNKYSNNQKVEYLLHTFDLKDRIIVNIKYLEEVLLMPINYNKVNDILSAEKIKAKEYLKKILD